MDSIHTTSVSRKLETIVVTFGSVDSADGGKLGYFGVTPTAETVRLNPIAGFVDAGASVGQATSASLSGMWQLFSGLGDLVVATFNGDTETLDRTRPASPIGLVSIGAQTQEYGTGFTLELLALVNVFVGLFNLIPVYPLDGGHFAVALYERIRGRHTDVRKLVPIAAAVFAFIVVLGVLGFYFDIVDPIELPR